MRTPTYRRAAGFTVIELLVVISIIAILVSLTSTAAMKILATGTRATTKADIGDFENSLRAAMLDMGGVEYVPSRILLKSNYPAVTAATPQLEKDSIAYLQKLFGKKSVVPGSPQIYQWLGPSITIPPTGVVLQGPQCMVFFLGGILDTSGGSPVCTGFSKNPSNPTAPAAAPGEKRYGPYYDFKSARLRQDAATGSLFYLDPYGSPYLFFSRGPNGTAVYDLQSCPTTVLPKSTAQASPPVDPTSPMTGLIDTAGVEYPICTLPDPPPIPVKAVSPLPYMLNASAAVNPQGWQIISAGANKVFGPGGMVWTPSSGYAGSVGDTAGRDDLSNFSRGPLGVGSN